MSTIAEIGFIGERKIRDLLTSRRIKYFQADIIFEEKGLWYLGEIKCQEPFKAPPFDGHGLPPWQVEARIRFCEQKQIIPVLFVVDTLSNLIYYQDLRKLHNGTKFISHTGKRVIYPLESFKYLELDNTK